MSENPLDKLAPEKRAEAVKILDDFHEKLATGKPFYPPLRQSGFNKKPKTPRHKRWRK